MSTIGALGSALSGLTRATDRLGRAAARTADPATADPARDAVDRTLAVHEARANISVIKTTDELLGQLINIKA
jgi:hypothetical protein